MSAKQWKVILEHEHKFEQFQKIFHLLERSQLEFCLLQGCSTTNTKITKFILDSFDFEFSELLQLLKHGIDKKWDLKIIQMLFIDSKMIIEGFFHSVKSNRMDLVKHFVEHLEIDVNITEEFGDDALIICIKCEGSLEIIKYLIDKGANCDRSSLTEVFPLIVACSGDRIDVVKYLVEKGGARVNVETVIGETSLNKAASNGRIDILKYLIESGADPARGGSPLFSAVQAGHLEVVQYLVEKIGIDPKQVDNVGHSYVHCAILHNKLEVLKYLLSKGASLEIHNPMEYPLLILACFFDRFEIVKWMLETHKAKIEINQRNVDGSTALGIAATIGRLETVRILVENGADLTLVNSKGETALDLAILCSNSKVESYLKEKLLELK